MSLEAWISEQLRKRGLSQAALARHLGVHPSAVSLMLKRQRKISVDELAKIEQFLGLSAPRGVGGNHSDSAPTVGPTLSVEVVGVVAGGIWREDRAVGEYLGKTVPVPAIPDQRFMGLEQKAVRVEGADLPNAPLGSYAIFVDYDPETHKIRPQDTVYVQRTRGELTEHGLWRVGVIGKSELRLERYRNNDVETIPIPADGSADVAIVGIVIGYYVPAT